MDNSMMVNRNGSMMTGVHKAMDGMNHHTGMGGMDHHTGMGGMDHHGGMGGMDHGGMGHGKMNMTGGQPMMMMMMQMYFTAGEKVTILFKEWKTNTAGELIASCLAIFILAIIYEGLKVGRQLLLTRSEMGSANVFMNATEGSGLSKESVLTVMPPRKKLCSSSHIIQTNLHMVQVFVGYLLMLAFMTYNCWVCIAVILGSGVGYFLFGWKTATIYSSGDHCN